MKIPVLLSAALLVAGTGSAATVTVTPVADVAVYSEGTNANGAGQFIFAGNNSSGNKRRSFLRFDIAAALPAGATVSSASLTLFCSNAPAVVNTPAITLNRASAAWTEGPTAPGGNEGAGAGAAANDTTWLHRSFSSSSWTAAGGDFSGTASATTTVSVDSASYVWTSAAMAADVQAWLDTPATNFGWALVGDESAVQTARRFDSRTNVISANRPALQIVYTTPSAVEMWSMY